MSKLIAKNRQALHDYEIIKKYEAGIVLKGWEIKSIRASNVTIKNAFCHFKKSELYVINMQVSNYMLIKDQIDRERKLLLHKHELRKLQELKDQKNLIIVVLALTLNHRSKAKLEIALAKAKTKHDKRQILKQKDAQKRIDKQLKYYS